MENNDLNRMKEYRNTEWKESWRDGYSPMSQPSGETTQKRVLALLRQEPTLTRKALAARIGITPDGIKYHLAKLTESGRIRRVGSTPASQLLLRMRALTRA